MNVWHYWRKCLAWFPQRTKRRAKHALRKLNRVGVGERLESRQLLAVDLGFSAATLNEAGGTAQLTATLAAPAVTRTTIDVVLLGSATRDTDYQMSATQIVIDPGQISGSVTVTGLVDTRTERPELIEARILAISGSSETWNGQPAYTYISDDDTPLVIAGTNGDDTLNVELFDTYFTYELNSDPVQTVNYSTAQSLQFDDTSTIDRDTINLTLASGGSRVTLAANSIVIDGVTAFDVRSTNLERQYVTGSAGDTATLEGTTGNDTYWGLPTYSVIVSGNMLNQVNLIRNVTVNGNGGTDIGLLYGNGATSVDAFIGTPTSASIIKQRGLAGDTTGVYANVVNNFRYVHAFADDANDTAVFSDREKDVDYYVASQTMAYVGGNGVGAYQNTVYNYKSTAAYSRGGADIATLYDSAGADTLTAYNVWTRLNYADRSVALAFGFRDVVANSGWDRTLDTVVFADSWTPDVDTTSSDPLERGRDDYLNVSGVSAEMIYGNRRVLAIGFEILNAFSFQGGTDTYTLGANSFFRPVISGFLNEASLGALQRLQMQTARNYLRDLSRFDILRYMRRGIDDLNPEFADIVSRISLEWSQNFSTRAPLNANNLVQVHYESIYDFSRLEQVENSLAYIDRRAVLQRLFDELTRNSTNNVERQTAIIEFGHKGFQHGIYMQPLNYDRQVRASTGKYIFDGTDVRDPLVLLELAEGRCGQVNKVIADLWHSLGFRVRLLGVNSHTSGEVMYEGQWHYNDAGLFGGTEIPVVPRAPGSTINKVPSFKEMRANPTLVDRMALYTGVYEGNRFPRGTSAEYASHWYYDDLNDTYTFYEKGPQADAVAQGSRDYGWMSGTHGSIDWLTRPPVMPHNTQPSAPWINNVNVNDAGLGGTVTVGWESSYDNWRNRVNTSGKVVLTAQGTVINDFASPTTGALYSDVIGYRVFVSRTSRGWNYNAFNGSDSVTPNVLQYKASSAAWTPAMYDRRYAAPPSDVMTLFVPASAKTVGGNELTNLELPEDGTYYVSIVAVDAYGQSIGKSNYSLSEEIKITV
ncbi:MAG: hypothetical protein JNM18_23295 [Planctomycetaceae bacterium]|nr:hypothetical protein [Planctomycetaceae bacterium]